MLESVLEFERAELRVASIIQADTADGSGFNVAFRSCTLRWRELAVQLPLIGKGWVELLYLDDELRIQRNARGDMLVATKVHP